MDRRQELLNKIKSDGFPDKEVALTLDEFFIGNNDKVSIGVNLYPDQPSPATFYKTFKRLIQSGQVERIYVRITDVDDTEWFFTDTVFIVGQIALEKLRQEVSDLHPTEIYSEWMYGLPANLHDIFSYKQVYSLWWD
jgi:hypothetical protein